MLTEHNLTDFNKRVQRLQARTGESQTELARALGVSRTTLHYYCGGQSTPKAAALYRLEQAERQAGELAPGAGPVPESAGGRSEGALTRHLRWLRDARQHAIPPRFEAT